MPLTHTIYWHFLYPQLKRFVLLDNAVSPLLTWYKGLFCYPITGLDRPLGFQEVEAHRISIHSAHEVGKVVSPTHRPPFFPQEISLVLIRLSRPQGHSTTGRINSEVYYRDNFRTDNDNVTKINKTVNGEKLCSAEANLLNSRNPPVKKKNTGSSKSGAYCNVRLGYMSDRMQCDVTGLVLGVVL
jgi:hypothetical protein